MHPVVFAPLAACIVSSAAALTVWLRDPGNRRAWPIVGASAAAAFWAFCEVVWNVADDRETALGWMRVASVGWCAIGPLALHGVALALDAWTPRTRLFIRALYAAGAAALTLTLGTSVVVVDARATAWGWATIPGPALLLPYGVTAGCAIGSLALWRTRLRRVGSRRRGSLVIATFATPLAIASVTDVILPLAGHPEVPKLGTSSVALLGALHLVSYVRFGAAPLVAEGFTKRMFQNAPEGIVAVSPSGHVRAANPPFAALWGGTPYALIGTDLAPHFSENLFHPPRDVRELECDLVPPDGRPVPVSVSTSLQIDRDGEPHSTVLFVRDRRELVSLRNRLLVSARMAAAGELAAGIAHEINNPLAYVRTNLGLLRQHWVRVEELLDGTNSDRGAHQVVAEAAELIEESMEGVERAVAIVRDVQEFSHRGNGGFEQVDLNRLIEQTLRVARTQIPGGARVELSLGPLPPIDCDPQRMKQVFLNLILNAAQAIDAHGTLRIASELLRDEVVVSVEDTGVGIDEDLLERIFDPFFTTKPAGRGTGLGLSIAFGIVQQHAGRFDVSSTPGEGTRMVVALPTPGRRRVAAPAGTGQKPHLP